MIGSLTGLTFDEVLKFLGLLKKSGQLRVKLNDSSHYNIAFKEGVLVGLSTDSGEEISNLEEIKEIIYNFSYDWQGEYHFEPLPAEQVKVSVNCEITSLIAQLEEVKKEWAQIKKVLPTLNARLKLTNSIKADVVVSPATWTLLTTIFSSATKCTPKEIQLKLGLTTLAVCRHLFALINDGLIEVEVSKKSSADIMSVKPGRYFKKSSLDLENEVVIPAEWVSYYERLDKNRNAKKTAAKR